MNSVEVMRVLTSLLWMALLVYLWKPFRKSLRLGSAAQPSERVMSAVWLLCLNRLTYSATQTFAPGDNDALLVCQVFAFAAGLYMLIVCSTVRRSA